MGQQAWTIRRLWDEYRFLLTAVFLAVLVYFAMGGILRNDFILFDDPGFITENPVVLQGLNRESIHWAFTTTFSGNWLPLTWLSHLADVELFGIDPAGHHLVSLIIHLLNVVILFGILCRFAGRTGAAVLAAVFWGIHPLRVESVAWAAERKDVLCCFFGLSAVWAYLWYNQHRTRRRYILVFVLLLLGLMSKSMLVTWPFVFLLLDFWPLRRFSRHQPFQIPQQAESIGVWLEKIPFVLLSAVFSMIAFLMQKQSGAVVDLQESSLLLRLENAVVSYVIYLWKMIYPVKLALLYPFPEDIAVSLFLFCLVLLLAVSVFVLTQRQKRPFLAFGWLWYLITLIPVIGLVRIGNQAMADRYTYIPSIGICIGIGWMFESMLVWGKRLKAVAWSAAAVACCTLIALTWRQTGFWQNSITIFSHTLAVTGDNPKIQVNYADALKRAGEFEEAISQCIELLDRHPDYPDALNLLGEIYQQTGDIDQAIVYWSKALDKNPASPAFLLYRLGSVYIQKEDYISAQKYSEQAITADPAFCGGYVNLGILFKKQGRTAEAIAMWEKSLNYNKHDVSTLKHIAWTLATAREADILNPPLALFYARRAAVITHDRSAEVLDILAAAYAADADYAKAVSSAQKAIFLADQKNQNSLVKAIEGRLKLYQEHKPYRE